ncbi:Gp15 family bacteriophage protein [Bacillus sp. JJ1562]|uniref:Gp15 family bacteriophage protein n=1 Tax=Bacillus sp. JJ1562 TaxID=3122960 RepID=UPI0030039055
MFDLAYPLTESVEIDGIEFVVDLSFDNVLRLIDMLGDKEIPDYAQIEIGFEMLLRDQLDYPFEKKAEIFYQLFESAIGSGQEGHASVDIEGNPMPQSKEKEVYSLKQDAEYIYASFMSDYGLDLFEQQGKLHWYKFKALLGGLTDGSKFLRVIEIRTADLPSGKGTEKQRKQMLELKRAYALKGDDVNDIEDD